MDNVIKKSGKIFDRIVYYMSFALASAAAVILIGLVLLVFVNVVMRALFNHPIPGCQDIVSVFIAIAGFCSIAMAILHGSLMCVDILAPRLSKTGSIILRSCTSLLGLVVMCLMTYAQFTRYQIAIGKLESTAVLRMPLGWVFLLITVSYTLSSCAQLIVFVKNLQGKKEGKE